MATNKRKDAAALFELLDKSTLKVPKTGGSLKIPSWWSSKTNPPTQRAAVPAVPATAPANGHPKPTVPADDADLVPEPLTARAKPFTQDAPAKPAPNIRPPARAAAAPDPRDKPLFAPQTHDQSTHPRQTQTRGAPPMWLLLAGGLVGLVILVIIVLGLVYSARPAKPPVVTQSTGGDGPRTVIPPPDDPFAPQGNLPPTNPQPVNPQPTGQARVVPFNEVQRVPNYYYLYAFTADEKTALANAQYLASNGISTSVSSTNLKKYFVVITVDGFAKLDDPAAKALRTRVVELGRAHPDAKKARKGVYDDAYFTKIVRQ